MDSSLVNVIMDFKYVWVFTGVIIILCLGEPDLIDATVSWIGRQ